jgi:hypothetical protein
MRMKPRRGNSLCIDCGKTTLGGEYYMVSDDLWAASGIAPNGGMLCLACLERRIGRPLTIYDFTAILPSDECWQHHVDSRTSARPTASSEGETMSKNAVPLIYVGWVRDVPLYFYPPQTDADKMPWVAVRGVLRLCGISRHLQTPFIRANDKFPDLAKRVLVEGGKPADLFGFQAVQGAIGALKDQGCADDALHMEIVKQFVAAAEAIYPGMFDTADSGERVVSSRQVAALLGEDLESVNARAAAVGAVPVTGNPPTEH